MLSMGSVDKLKAAFWCRLVFSKWGVSNPNEMSDYQSRSAVVNKKKRTIDRIFESYEGTNNQVLAKQILINKVDVGKWRDYFLGKRSPSSKFVNEVDKLVPGSEFFFIYGAQSLFNVMSAKSPEEALECLKEEFLISVEKSEGVNFYHKKVIGEVISENEAPDYKYELIPITEEEIEDLQSNTWLDEYRKLRVFLPNIDSFYNSFPKLEVDNLYIHIAYEVISAKFLTDENKYHNLAKILFVRHGVNAIENFELELGISSSLWLDIPFIKEAFDWYSTYLTDAAKA
jgi:hypothetical protein